MPQKMNFLTATNLVGDKTKMDFSYKFTVSILDKKIPDAFVLSYFYDRDFLNYMYPKRILKVLLLPQDYYDIVSKLAPDKPFVPVTLTIDITARQSEINMTPVHVTASYLQGEFTGIVDKTKVDSTVLKTAQQASQKTGDKQAIGVENVYELNIALFDFDDLNFTKEGVVSGNIGSGKKVEDIIKHAFDVCKGKNKCKLAMAPPDNKTPVKNCIISAQGFLDFLKFIDREYGVYKSKYNVYVEDGTCYILNTEKNDTGMNKVMQGTKDDKIDINVYEAKNKPLQLYGISLNEDHFRYNVFKNSMIQDEITLDAIMRPVEYTINSSGQKSKSQESQNKKETISPTVKVNAGRTRSITKDNKNPSFKGVVILDDVPVHVMPYTIVNYVADNRKGTCMIERVTNMWAKGRCVTELHIKSYDKFLPYNVPESQKGKNPDKTSNQK